jgi:TatA/E family protein of Tat protein translocase
MFDPSAPHIIILLVVVLLLFGSTRLPGAAEALGKSMRVFKHEAKKLHDDEPPADAKVAQGSVQQAPAPQPLASHQAPPDATQQQLLDMQRQIQDLQRQSPGGNGGGAVGNGAPLAEGQRGSQPL